MNTQQETQRQINMHIVITEKGGSGKTTVVNALASLAKLKEINIKVEDFDPSSKSSFSQLKWANVQKADILGDNKQIDDSKFEYFIDEQLDGDVDYVVWDCGGGTSTQLLNYLQDPLNKSMLKEYISEGVNFFFHIIIAGGDNYVTCADYAEQLLTVTQDLGKRYLVLNEYFDITKEQLKDLKELSQSLSCRVRKFNLIEGNGEAMLKEISACRIQGVPPLEHLSRAALRRFKKTLNNLEFEF